MDNYNVIKQIGKGAFSNVHLCKKDKVNKNSILLNSIDRYIGILDQGQDKDQDLFIIKEINIDNLVRKYINKSRAEILNRINSSDTRDTRDTRYSSDSRNSVTLSSLSKQESVNITPYSTKSPIFNKEIMKKLDTEEEYYYKRLKDLIDSEIEILKKLNHNNIIKYFSSNIDMSNGNQIYCIKMEYCNYGDLHTVLKKQSRDKQLLSNFKLRNTFGGFEDSFIKKFLKDTVSGLIYLHDLNIIHRDIKLHNVLIKNEIVGNDFLFKLSDFGFACFDIDTELNESLNISDFDFSTSSLKKKYYKLCGTPYYMAPEIILNIEEFDQISTSKKVNERLKREFLGEKMVKFYDKKVDLWSYGICLYELIFNTLPFSGISDIHDLKDFFSRPTTQLDLDKKIDNKSLIDKNMKDILKSLLTINPSFRISTNELHNIVTESLNDLHYVNEFSSEAIIESEYNIITSSLTDPKIDQLSKNVVYEPINLETQKDDVMFLTSWDKINKASSLITKISVDNAFMKWLLNKR